MKQARFTVLLAATVFLYLPVVVLAVFSFNSSELMAFPLSGFTLGWYSELFDNKNMIAGLLTSILLAQPVAIFATLFGLLAALALTGLRKFATIAFGILLLVPFLVPKGVLAIAQIMLMSRLGIARGTLPLVLAQAAVILPFTTLVIASVAIRLDKALEEAARDLGASPWQAFRRVVFPQLKIGLSVAYSIAVILSISDLTLSVFLSGRIQPLSIIVASAFRTRLSPDLNAMQVLVLLATIAIVIAIETARRRRAAQGRIRPAQQE
mgnify:CR=1 FL=1